MSKRAMTAIISTMRGLLKVIYQTLKDSDQGWNGSMFVALGYASKISIAVKMPIKAKVATGLGIFVFC